MQPKSDILLVSMEELKKFVEAKNHKTFRAKQIYEWLWKNGVRSFSEMNNIPKELISELDGHYVILRLDIESTQKSVDGTIKTAFKLHDDHLIEGVLIPTSQRTTACISSQVGCSMTCTFCATGRLERKRNLEESEIFDQVVAISQQAKEHHGKTLSNIVYMGMGEPLLNYANVLKSIKRITDPKGLGMSSKRITVSTVGIAKMIKKLGDDDVKFNLALSLHAANDEKRSKIIPINEQNSLDTLKEAIIYFHERTGTRITYEYIIFKNFNDELTDAHELAEFCKITPCKVNVIEYNPIGNTELSQAEARKVDAFVAHLESRNIIVNVRRSRGKDIDAACGQLANKGHKNKQAN
jgi:23S rRNA (adenine2503-C2)-methyltransferase